MLTALITRVEHADLLRVVLELQPDDGALQRPECANEVIRAIMLGCSLCLLHGLRRLQPDGGALQRPECGARSRGEGTGWAVVSFLGAAMTAAAGGGRRKVKGEGTGVQVVSCPGARSC